MNVFLLTTAFPYGNGECFLEEEMEYWKDNLFFNVSILPLNTSIKKREIPENIVIKTIFNRKYFHKLFYYVKSLFYKMFWFDFFKYNPKKLSVNTFRMLISTFSYSLFVMDRLLKEDIPQNSIIYSYWFDVLAYGAVFFKQYRPDIKVFSRAHGYDVYKERRFAEYMPLKNILANGFDRIYAISNKGASYLIENYGIEKDRVYVSRLGVQKQKHLNRFPKDLFVLTCSNVILVKQLNILIDALSLISINLTWVHIGDGEIMSDICQYARKKLDKKKNIDFKFLGCLTNEEVIDFYNSNYISCFINCSKSEGLPVSIMEAQSFGIPVIAPDIGGISEQVTDETGILLPANFSAEDLSKAIIDIIKFHNLRSQNKILEHWSRLFSAENNYTQFISSFLQ